jgi:poly(A) polymerase
MMGDADRQTRLDALLARPPVAQLMALLNADGAETRIVGGAVRNTLLGVPTSDIDLATTLLPEAVMARTKATGLKVVPTGITHGTVTVVVAHAPFEVTTLRRDIATDGRHATVAFSRSFEDDALRRDFTINQLSLAGDGVVHDYAGGLADLSARKVRFIGDPRLRIGEDFLRIMRFFRFHAEYGTGPLDAAGLSACIALTSGMARLSAERVRAELLKLLGARGAREVVPDFVGSGVWGQSTGGHAADLEAFDYAITAFPDSDAVARLAALGVRTAGDPGLLDEHFRLSRAERTRLDDVARLLGGWSNPETLTARDVQRAGLDGGRTATADTLGVLAARLGVERARQLAELPTPVSPFRGAAVLALGVKAGPEIGIVLASAHDLWADIGFPDEQAAQAQCLADAVRDLTGQAPAQA